MQPQISQVNPSQPKQNLGAIFFQDKHDVETILWGGGGGSAH